MTQILTLVASTTPLTEHLLSKITGTLSTLSLQGWNYVKSNECVAECELDKPPSPKDTEQLRAAFDPHKIDVFITPSENRRKKLLLADMDSTIIAEETLDELAAHAGIKDQIAAITARAMNGELDFTTALRQRVALLKDLPAEAVQQTLENITLNQGAQTLVKTMKKHGATCVLVSGGFTIFTEFIAEKLGFDHHHGNTLNIEKNRLTGTVTEPILDKNAKVTFLNHYIEKHGLSPADVMTIGDGANDLPMLQAAQERGGLGIGYHAKPSVTAELTNNIRHGDLTAALYAQGYHKEKIKKT